MKIVYLADSDLPNQAAHGVHIMHMCDALSELGHEVVLVLARENGTRAKPRSGDELFRYYGLKPRFRIERVGRSLKKGAVYWFALKMARLAGKERPDLIYGRFLAGCVFSALAGARRAPVVYETHAAVAQAGRVSDLLYRIACATGLLDYTVVVTRGLKTFLMEAYRQPEERMIVAPDAAAPAGDEAVVVPATHELHVGYTGHLYEGRGIELIVTLARRCPWALFHVVGGEREAVDGWRARVDGVPNVVFHGYVEPREVRRYQNAMDVLLAPYESRVRVSGNTGDTALWMSPLKIFEYMSAGKAIVCSDLPVLREVLTDGKNALLCAPDSAPEWEQALVRLRGDAGLRAHLGATARGDFQSRYTWHRRAAQVLERVTLPAPE